MNQATLSVFLRRICWTLSISLLSCTLLAPSAAFGQESPADATKAEPTAGATVGLSQLADLLEDDSARAQLVQTLRSAAADQLKQAPAEPMVAPGDSSTEGSPVTKLPKSESGAVTKTGQGGSETSPVREIARATGDWAEHLGSQVISTWHMLLNFGEDSAHADTASSTAFDGTAFWNALVALVAVIAATLVAYFVLRLLAGSLFAPLARLPQKGARGSTLLVRRFGAVVMALIVDVVVVLLACAAGYATGLLLLGEPGEIGPRETLFINAFAVVELVKVVIRAVFSSRHDSLRLMKMSGSVAGWWSIRLRWFVGVTGYCLLFVVPIVSALSSPALGSVVNFVVMVAAYLYALQVVLGNRKLLTQRLLDRADNASLGFFAVVQRVLARIWIVLALAYVTTLFLGSQIDPAGVLPFVLAATLKSLVAAAIALGLSGWLSHALGKRISVSERTRQRMPLLENRVNAYVPATLKIVRFFILLALALVLADAWHLFDLRGWLDSATGTRVVGVVFHLLVIFAAAILFWVVIASILEHKLGMAADGGPSSARQDTLLALIRNAIAIVIITMTVMVALSQIGVDIGPLLAGAGVIGLAIGFGSQKLVADVITGIFIQLENAVSTGDVVSLAGVTGTAEKITIRSLSVRDLYGTLHVVPFSSASVVSNYMREFGYHTYHYRIAYREDIDEAIRHLRAAFEDLQNDPEIRPNLLEDISIPGVTSLAENAVEIRVMIKTLPGTQWGVGRAFNRLVKMHFDAAGIEMPTAHRTLYFGRDKEGWSSPARVRMVDTKNMPLRGDVDISDGLDTSGREADVPGRDAGE